MPLTVIKPFDIVSSYYVDLNGDIKSFSSGKPQRALFFVVAVDRGNALVCKITSQSTFHNNPSFTYTLSRDTHTFLQTTSFIQLSKFHTISTATCKKVGEVANFCRPFIQKQLKLLFDTLIQVVAQEVPLQPYVSPNVRKFAGVRVKSLK